MTQLNFYVSDLIEKKIRAAAKKRKMTVSAYVAEIVKKEISAVSNTEWDEKFFSLAGSWEGSFDQPERLPPQEREKL